MPRPSQEDAILAAALRCFADLGYDGTRVRHIAERAGVTEGALYRHYASKEDLAQALYGRYMGMYSDQLRRIAAADAPLQERLLDCLRASLDSYRAQPDAMTFTLMRQHTFMPALPPDYAYPIDIIQGLIRDGQEAGLVRDGQPNLLAAIFLGCLLRPLIVSQLTTPGALDLLNDHQHDQTILDAAWAALARPPS